MNHYDTATHWVAILILNGDWYMIRRYALCLAPCGPAPVKASQDALDIYYDYLGYDPDDILL